MAAPSFSASAEFLGVEVIQSKTERIIHGKVSNERTSLSFRGGGILIVGHYYYGGAILSTGYHSVTFIGGVANYQPGGAQEISADTTGNYKYSFPSQTEYWYFETYGAQ